MNNQRIEKVTDDIERTKAKIVEYQAKLRTLERQKTELENERIVALVRCERISDAQLHELMNSFKKDKPASAPAQENSEPEDMHYADTD